MTTETNQTAARKTLGQLIRYGIVGGSSALLELVIFQGLSVFAQASIPVANLTAITIATIANFLAHRGVTFKSSANPARSALLYLVLFAFNSTFSTVVISYMTGVGIMPLVAKLATMVCIVAWNFVLFRKVVFK